MIVTFCGPLHGQIRTTSNMGAVGTMLAMNNHLRLLMAHSHLELSTLENSYYKVIGHDVLSETASGMDNLEELVRVHKATPESIRDNTVSVIRDRLDLIHGPTNQKSLALKQTMHHIFDNYKRSYDLLFVDVNSGTNNEFSNFAIQNSDLVVVSLNQNKYLLDQFFNDTEWRKLLKDKSVVYCLGAYDRRSKYTKTRISKMYGVPAKLIGAVPYNTRFLDAQNDQHIIDFLDRVRSKKMKFLEFDEEAYFAQSVRKMGKLILSELRIMPISEEDIDD